MLDLVLPLYAFNLAYSQKLAADLPDEKLCAQPVEGVVMNHAAWTLGHLALVSDNCVGLLGGARAFDDKWKELFGMGTKPLADRAAYPSKTALLKSLEDAHARLVDAIGKATHETLASPSPERIRARFPTLGLL